MLKQRRRRRTPTARATLGWLLVAVLYAAAAALNILLTIMTLTWPPALVALASILLSAWSFRTALHTGQTPVTPSDQTAVPQEPALDPLPPLDHFPQ